MASLNGVHMYAKSHKVELLHSLMTDHGAVWKEFYESVTLIGISTGCTPNTMNKLLQSVFNSMVLIVGLDGIKSPRNFERLKRELRPSFSIIDRLLDSVDSGDSSSQHFSLVMIPETILCSQNHLIEIVLDAYTECVDSAYSCVLIDGKVAVATESWWSLHPDEIKLLAILADVESEATSKDILVFLPYKSPNVAYRYVTCTLIPNVKVCCLCGPTPSLSDIERSATQCFHSTFGILESAVKCHPRNLSNSLSLDGSILGILLVKKTPYKYVISAMQQNNKRISSGSHRLNILRTFYYRAVLNVLLPDDPASYTEDEDKSDKKPALKGFTSTSKETFWCSEYHKCHAIAMDVNVLCVLYNSSIHTHAMRTLSQNTMKILVSDKHFCW